MEHSLGAMQDKAHMMRTVLEHQVEETFVTRGPAMFMAPDEECRTRERRCRGLWRVPCFILQQRRLRGRKGMNNRTSDGLLMKRERCGAGRCGKLQHEPYLTLGEDASVVEGGCAAGLPGAEPRVAIALDG